MKVALLLRLNKSTFLGLDRSSASPEPTEADELDASLQAKSCEGIAQSSCHFMSLCNTLHAQCFPGVPISAVFCGHQGDWIALAKLDL